MKNLIVYLKKYRQESILAPLFKLLEALFDLLVPLLVAKMIDTDILSEKSTVFLCFGGLLLMAMMPSMQKDSTVVRVASRVAKR